MRKLPVKFCVKLVCVLCLWALWKATANLAFCYLFWVTTLAWAVRCIIHTKTIGGWVILLGITSNALVTLWNQGVMPAVGVPSTFQPASPIWNVSGKGQLLALGDQAAFHGCSIGDLCLIAGLLLIVIWKVTCQLSSSKESGSAATQFSGSMTIHQH
ncbi:MAG: hypothetical protein WAU58_05930 [Terriglobales bacterium]